MIVGIIIAAAIIFIGLLLFAAIKVSRDADDSSEQIYMRWKETHGGKDI